MEGGSEGNITPPGRKKAVTASACPLPGVPLGMLVISNWSGSGAFWVTLSMVRTIWTFIERALDGDG
jgi:hypothetical protein